AQQGVHRGLGREGRDRGRRDLLRHRVRGRGTEGAAHAGRESGGSDREERGRPAVGAMKLVFVLCEGAHDIALVARMIQRLPGVSEYRRKLKEYPAPFNSFWEAQIKNVVVPRLLDHRADNRGKLQPPWLEKAFQTGDTVYMLFDMQ